MKLNNQSPAIQSLPNFETAAPVQEAAPQLQQTGMESMLAQAELQANANPGQAPALNQTSTAQGTSTLGLMLGQGAPNLQASVEDALGQHNIGTGEGDQFLRFGPPVDMEGLVPVKLPQTFAFLAGNLGSGSPENTSLDYPQRTAFVDSNNQEFFLKVNSDFGQGRDYWFGPIPMNQTGE